MELERELAQVFLEEARGHVAEIADEKRARDVRLRAAQALTTAAGLVGADELRALSVELEGALSRKGAVEPLLARVTAQLDAIAAHAQGPAPPDMGFDAAESELLHGFFREEAHDHLEGLTRALIDLEKDRTRRPLIDELMRKTHTLKGSAATVGLHAVSEAAHELEEVFTLLRGGFLTLERDTPGMPNLFDALMTAVDTLRSIVEIAEQPVKVAPLAAKLKALLQTVRPFRGEAPALARPARRRTRRTDPESLLDKTTPMRRRTPTGPITIRGPVEAERSTGDLLGSEEARRAEEEANELDRRLQDRRRDDHMLRVDASRIDRLMDAAGELVFDRTRIERRVQELRNVVRDLGRARGGLRELIGEVGTKALPVAKKLLEIEDDFASHIAHLTRASSTLLEDAEALRRTTAMLQEGLTQVRMTSVRLLFQRLARPLRDMERLEGKRVDVVTAGEDTELDRAVVEQILDPLIALLRNAVAHGIEPAAERARRGKPPAGKILLGAIHQGDSVFLEVADDGAGIDTDKIRKSLIAAGRMTPEVAAEATDERIITAIFEPGVSTRESADELAGRGVGLDVVRENIARLGGEITVSSTTGTGTRFVIRLPLTTAITQALLFKVAGQVYALPNVHVVETLTVEIAEHVMLGDEPVPLVSLHELLNVDPPADPKRVPVVVLDFAGRRFAASCDKVIGPREIIVKSLGPLLAPLSLYAGATISGAGKVQLILDPAALAQVAYPSQLGALPASGTPSTPSSPWIIAETGEHLIPTGAATTPATGIPVPISAGTTSTISTRYVPHESGSMPAFFPAPHETLRRILIADDSRSVREAVSRMLAADGYIVDVATDGSEAWSMLHEVSYNLLVTDLEMPRLSGVQLIERVRGADGALGALRIVAISSRSTAAHRDRALSAGADDFLPKPVTRQDLAQRVIRLAATRRGDR